MEIAPRSPATDDYMSPTFSHNSFDGTSENGDMSPTDDEGGYTYDAEAAREQARKIEEKRKNKEMLSLGDIEMDG